MRLAAEILLSCPLSFQVWLLLVNRSQGTEAGYTVVCSLSGVQAMVKEHSVRMKSCRGTRHTDLLCMIKNTFPEGIHFPSSQPQHLPPPDTKQDHTAETLLYEMIMLSSDGSLCESIAFSNCERECIQTHKEPTSGTAF